MSKYKPPTTRYALDAGSHVDAWHRFSTNRQDDASALVAINEYCATHGYIIDRQWGKPATSGSVITTTKEWLEFVAAMEERPVRERRVRGIVAWDLGRLGRDQIDAAFYVTYLRRLGYAVLSVSDHIPDNDTAPIVEAVRHYQNEQDLRRISANVKRSLAMIRADGYTTGGFPPKGFVAVKEQNRSHPTTYGGLPRLNAKWVRGGDDEGAVALAWAMKTDGASDNAIHEATHLYRARHCYHDVWRRHIYVDGDYVSEEDWQKVQSEMDARRQRPRLGTSTYLLAGLVYCPCGRLMIGHSQPRQKSGVRRDAYRPGDDAISYYLCPGHQQHAGCPMGKIHAEVIETGVVALLHDDILTDVHLTDLRRRLGHDLETQQDQLAHQITVLRQRHDQLATEIKNLTRGIAVANSVIAGDAIAELVVQLQERAGEKKIIEQQIAEAEHLRKERNPHIVSDETWQAAIAWMRTSLEQDTKSPQVRDVVRSLVQRVDIWPDKGGFTLRYYLGDMDAAVCLPSTPGPVPSNIPQHLLLRLDWRHPLTRHGNQHTHRRSI